MTIQQELSNRNITECLHFTTNRGIIGILSSGALLSRYRLPLETRLHYLAYVNSVCRPEESDYFDKTENWLDYVNLSFTEINSRFFKVSQRWHQGADVWWGILSFDAAIAEHPGVYFTTTNNGYDLCRRGAGYDGLKAMFQSPIGRKAPSWYAHRLNRVPSMPTCEQAELLYPGQVAVEYLRKVYVKDDYSHDQAYGWLREFGLNNVEVILSSHKFEGCPN
ncbi:DarT ssDNA thymidine ADP-ribosyltransferase family protein [Pseudomonas lopnurensis]|uniref:DarT ssDNA thymidine ADP-ribosyltransferase family protein n=1 Tax=Pseudomonas lopnurensis TaxID=1477517 RepID=UPI0028B17AB9|nr:DarT ssDNA thymidine ADP-ribosyltransferase family protein [Pseudomonas lopnurensis]